MLAPPTSLLRFPLQQEAPRCMCEAHRRSHLERKCERGCEDASAASSRPLDEEQNGTERGG